MLQRCVWQFSPYGVLSLRAEEEPMEEEAPM